MDDTREIRRLRELQAKVVQGQDAGECEQHDHCENQRSSATVVDLLMLTLP